jgi:hypothetical protein
LSERLAWVVGALLLSSSWAAAQGQQASDYMGTVRDMTPNRIVTADPFSSIDTSKQVSAALSTPLPDQLSANLQVTPSGAAATASIAPFGFTPRYYPVLSELRLELFGNGAAQPEFGFGVSFGYNSATHRLNEGELDLTTVQGFLDGCVKSSPPSAGASVAALATKVQTLLQALSAPFVRGPVDDVRAAVMESAMAPNHDAHIAAAAAQLLILTRDNWVLEALRPQVLALRATITQTLQQLRGANPPVAAISVELSAATQKLLGAYQELAVAIQKASALAQTPPSDADFALHVISVAGWIAKSSDGDALLKEAPNDVRGEIFDIAASDAAVIAARNAYSDAVGQCVEKKLAQKRVETAFSNAGSLYLKGTFHFYPVGSGPTFKNSDGTVAQPFNNALSLASITLTGNYFPSRFVRVQPIIGYAWSYASPSSTTLNQNFAAALDLGWSRGFSKPDKDGFQPTFGFGIDWGLDKCIDAAGCARGDIANYSGPKPKVNIAFNNAFYAFVRVSAKLQIQLTAPVKVYLLASAIDATSASTQIVEFIPTLTASVAGWTIAQPTQGQ